MDSIHPSEERCITLREAMHLMGLPHDFELTDRKHFHHITQNVPVRTAGDMTQDVVRFCRGELKSSGFRYYKQDNLAKRCEVPDQKSNSSIENLF